MTSIEQNFIYNTTKYVAVGYAHYKIKIFYISIIGTDIFIFKSRYETN